MIRQSPASNPIQRWGVKVPALKVVWLLIKKWSACSKSKQVIHLLILSAVMPSCSVKSYPRPLTFRTQTNPPVAAGVLAGTVLLEGSQQALANVIVEVFRPNETKPFRVSKTGPNGRFRFGVTPGSYVLHFSLYGFDQIRQPVEMTGAGLPEIEVGLPPGT